MVVSEEWNKSQDPHRETWILCHGSCRLCLSVLFFYPLLLLPDGSRGAGRRIMCGMQQSLFYPLVSKDVFLSPRLVNVISICFVIGSQAGGGFRVAIDG